MNELQKMTRKIRLLSLFIGGTLSILAAIIWHDKIDEVAGGVVIGLMCALIGFQMIQSMSLGIEESNAKSKAYVGYLLRFIFYACVFTLSMYSGINVFALLVGFMCHKAAIIVYSVRYREEMD